MRVLFIRKDHKVMIWSNGRGYDVWIACSHRKLVSTAYNAHYVRKWSEVIDIIKEV